MLQTQTWFHTHEADLPNNHAPKDNDLQQLVLPLLCIKHGGGRWLCLSCSLSSKETGKLSPTMNLDEEEN